jgi:hypothetical protein
MNREVHTTAGHHPNEYKSLVGNPAWRPAFRIYE